MTDLQKDALTDKIVGCAIEVHRHLGPGLLESVCQSALCIELEHHGLKLQCQLALPIKHRERLIGRTEARNSCREFGDSGIEECGTTGPFI